MLRFFLITSLFLCLGTFADDNNTVKIKAEKFVYKASLPGLILSSDVEKIKIDSKNWSKWILEFAVKHGEAVKKGDVLAKFESEEYNKAVAASKRSLETQKANFVKSQKLFEISMKKMDFEKKKAELNASTAEKLALIYKEKGHGQAKINYEQDLIDARNSLEYQKEELKQLKKMYDEDKITEETEEIVLKRQQNYVNSLTRRIKTRELAIEEAVNVKLPNNLFNFEYKKALATLDAEKSKVEWEIFALTERLKLESQQEALKKSIKAYEELVSDKKFLEIKASKDGVIVYGAITSGGKWGNLTGTQYKKGKSFVKGASLFSLVNPKKFKVSAKANFTQIQYVNEKSSYFIEIPGKGIVKLKLSDKSSVPNNNTFKVTFNIADAEGAFHGTESKVQLIKVIGQKVISVPDKAIHSEEEDPTKSYVNLVKGNKLVKAYVETGVSYDGNTVIKSGLSEGAEVKTK